MDNKVLQPRQYKNAFLFYKSVYLVTIAGLDDSIDHSLARGALTKHRNTRGVRILNRNIAAME